MPALNWRWRLSLPAPGIEKIIRLDEVRHAACGCQSAGERADTSRRAVTVSGRIANISGAIRRSRIHDWDDARALVIFNNTATAIGSKKGHVALLESVIPERPEPDFGKFLDI